MVGIGILICRTVRRSTRPTWRRVHPQHDHRQQGGDEDRRARRGQPGEVELGLLQCPACSGRAAAARPGQPRWCKPGNRHRCSSSAPARHCDRRLFALLSAGPGRSASRNTDIKRVTAAQAAADAGERCSGAASAVGLGVVGRRARTSNASRSRLPEPQEDGHHHQREDAAADVGHRVEDERRHVGVDGGEDELKDGERAAGDDQGRPDLPASAATSTCTAPCTAAR